MLMLQTELKICLAMFIHHCCLCYNVIYNNKLIGLAIIGQQNPLGCSSTPSCSCPFQHTTPTTGGAKGVATA